MAKVNWSAVYKAANYYDETWGLDPQLRKYNAWMLDNWGIDHSDLRVKIVDEAKYAFFLLRWAK